VRRYSIPPGCTYLDERKIKDGKLYQYGYVKTMVLGWFESDEKYGQENRRDGYYWLCASGLKRMDNNFAETDYAGVVEFDDEGGRRFIWYDK
jgi:hypothetical protein